MQLGTGKDRYVSVVTHAGHVIAFTNRETANGSGEYRIGYSVLTPSPDNPNQDAAWKDYAFLKFSREIRTVGRSVITIDFKDAEIPVAEAPFQVVSDNRFIYIFRQSLNATLYVDRFTYDDATARLVPMTEVRFRRSRKADIPLDRRDTFGTTDLNNRVFTEPTVELDFITGVTEGRFAVLLLPTELAGVDRWQIFAEDADSGRLNSFSILRSSQGMFDLSDSLDPETGTVPPDRSYRLLAPDSSELSLEAGAAAVLYNQQEWLEDDYGQIALQKRETRVMVAVPAGSEGKIAVLDFGVGIDGRLAQVGDDLPVAPGPAIGTALAFNRGAATRVDFPALAGGTGLTIEAWVYPREFSSSDELIVMSAADAPMAFALGLRSGVPVFTGPDSVSVQGELALSTRGWTHLAGVWDGATALLYVNGQPYDWEADPLTGTAPDTGYRLGGAEGFTGGLDEVRLWTVARTAQELVSTMNVPITPGSPGWNDLAGYWPLDEPEDDARFTTVPNRSHLGVAANGTLVGPEWIPTSAPVGASLAPVAWDVNGLTLGTMHLPFAATAATPVLREGTDSQLHLYFVDRASSALLAAHYSVVVARATYVQPWTAPDPQLPENDQSGVVRFVARQPGTPMNNPNVSPEFVTIEALAKDPQHARVTLRSYTGYSEVWPKVPLDLESFMAVLNGDAAQTSTDPAELARGVLMYDYLKVQVTPAGGQEGALPAPGTGSALFRVLPDFLPDNGFRGVVATADEAALARGRAGTDGWWQTAPPLLDINMHDPGQYVRVLNAEQIETYEGPLVLDRDLALEAWIRPVPNPLDEPAVLFVFNKPGVASYLLGLDTNWRPYAADGEVVSTTDAVVPADGTWTHLAASYRTDYGIQLGGARYLDVGNDRSLDTPDAITAEAWVRLDRLGIRQTVIAKTEPARGRSWDLTVDPQGRLTFTVNQSTATGAILRTATSAGTLDIGKWHHIAGVYDVAYERQVAIMFNAGSYVSVPQPTNPPVDGITVAMWVKRVGSSIAGTQVLMTSVDPQGPIPAVLSVVDGFPTFKVFPAGKSFTLKAPGLLRSDDWVHLAGSYSAAEGAQLVIDGVRVAQAASTAADAETESPEELWPDREPLLAAAGGAAYTFGGHASGEQSFTGMINEVSLWNRGLSLDEIRQKIRHPLATTERGLSGYWRFNDLYGTTVMDLAGTANGTLVGGNFIRVDKGAFAHKVFIDGHSEAFDRVLDPIVLTEAGVTLGSGHFENYLQGAIAEMRLWKIGRMNWQIEYFASRDLEPNAEGLIALWAFESGRGRIVYDGKGDNNAVIRDGEIDLTEEAVDKMWIRTNFKAAWTFYLNGVRAVSRAAVLDNLGYGDPQALIASLRYDDIVARPFTGEINELRVWSGQRTGDQVRGQMYTPLTGAEAGLAAYWPFGDGSGRIIADATGYGANGRWAGLPGEPKWQLSTAPVSIEPPQFRCVPGQHSQPMQQSGDWAPGTGSYGQLETDARGNMASALKLAYAFVGKTTGTLELFSGFKIGDLVLQYVGQAQLAPTLIGYIEGPPPLPAENLKVFPDEPGAYIGAATLQLDENGTRIYTYSAQRDVGTDASLNTRMGFKIEAETSAGLGVEQEVFSMSASLGIAVEADESLSNTGDANVSEEQLVGARKYVEVRGAWAPNTYQIDKGVGSLFYPTNMGYALVRSGTADLFAMRLAATGTLVGYTMRPNPDIPEDINIVMFRIRPTYIKNGTLDGWIGFEPDNDYKFLQPGERGSYFKPLEAYALKQLIEREKQERQNWFDRFDAAGLGRRERAGRPGSIDLADEERSLANVLMGVTAKSALSSEEWKARMARRNMVNTYVWTADGGLYSEEEQFIAVREESTGGSYYMSTKAGMYTELSFNIGPSFSLDAMFGAHIMTQAAKSSRESWLFGMDVFLSGERYIGLIEDQDGYLVYTDKPSPGKVKAYRFMSFYMAPSKRNFDDFKEVIDPDWLNSTGPFAGQYNPDALALRQALSNVNEVWRVLHRVTYVSRTPPQTQNEGESLPANARRPDEQSIINNLWLIDELPTDLQAPNPMAQVSVEADALLAQLEQNPVWGPLLAADQSAYKQDVMTYMRSYYGLPGSR